MSFIIYIDNVRWNYDLSNPIKTTEDPNYDPTADYTMNLHPDISTVGNELRMEYIDVNQIAKKHLVRKNYPTF